MERYAIRGHATNLYAIRERCLGHGCPDDGDGFGTMYGASTLTRAAEVLAVYQGRNHRPEDVRLDILTREQFDAINARCPDQGPGEVDRELVEGEEG